MWCHSAAEPQVASCLFADEPVCGRRPNFDRASARFGVEGVCELVQQLEKIRCLALAEDRQQVPA